MDEGRKMTYLTCLYKLFKYENVMHAYSKQNFLTVLTVQSKTKKLKCPIRENCQS
jgi:hypothetical protein